MKLRAVRCFTHNSRPLEIGEIPQGNGSAAPLLRVDVAADADDLEVVLVGRDFDFHLLADPL